MGNLARITETSSKEQNQWEQMKLLQTQQHTSELSSQIKCYVENKHASQTGGKTLESNK
jgi:serine kinase of HPr protein (carbohydrate metabolism regulator)